ncbi:MAG: glycosyltransferase family 2 protein [Chloroflexi bacterium]|nr:glycosyltransferase family 2 protein [Chloroflexota bacterium]
MPRSRDRSASITSEVAAEASAGDGVTISQSTLLAPDVLLCLGSPGEKLRSDSLHGSVISDGVPVGCSGYGFSWDSPTSGGDSCLMVLRLAAPLAAEARLGRLILTTDGRIVSDSEGSSDLTDLRSMMRRISPEDQPARQRILDFLVSAASKAGSVAVAQLSESLHAAREAIRERHVVSVISRDVPRALYVDSIMRAGHDSFYLRGWSWCESGSPQQVTAYSPEGARVDLVESMYRYPRPDIDAFYGRSSASGDDAGFIAYLQMPALSELLDGWILEMEDASGVIVEHAAPAVTDDPVAARDSILADISHEKSAATRSLLMDQVYPAISRIQTERRSAVRAEVVEQYGTPPASPDVSIIVPLYKRIDFLEQQLAQFVHDPEIARSDLIYVLDSPELGEALLQKAAWLYPLYRVPFRVAILSVNGGFAFANNAGAALARGRLLLLLNSDILPDRPGWLGTLREVHDHDPTIGAVAPKLLFEDGSLQHAGMFFQHDQRTRSWSNEHYFKGLHGSLPAANVARQVPAVTAACMLIDVERYRSMDGLRGIYVQGDYEDSDLCLRLYEQGLRSWYTPEAHLFHLEGQSYPSAQRQIAGRYNRLIHTELWKDVIPAVMAELDHPSPAAFSMPLSEARSAQATSRPLRLRQRPRVQSPVVRATRSRAPR